MMSEPVGPVVSAAEELLASHAAGTLSEGESLLAATHIALSRGARATARRLDAIGGALLEEIAPAPIAGDALDRFWARAEAAPALPPRQPTRTGLVPAPLADYVGPDLDALPWRTVVAGVEEAAIALHHPAPAGQRTALLRIAPERAIPRHTHAGTEMLLVLDGSFSDESGRYVRGDVQIGDETVTHRPKADAGRPCLCLVVTQGRIRLTGPFARLLNPFLRR